MADKQTNTVLGVKGNPSFSILEQPKLSLIELTNIKNKPCLSLYQPTHRHHPQSSQDTIRFRNLIKKFEDMLQTTQSPEMIESLLKPFHELADDHRFWNHSFDGLAVLAAPGFFKIFKLQRPVPEMAFVNDTFHISPLVRILQSADRYHILGLKNGVIKLFEGNRDVLDEVELAPGVPKTPEMMRDMELSGALRNIESDHGSVAPLKDDDANIDDERFFRFIDRTLFENHSRPSGLPLLLAALPEQQNLFRKISHNPFLIAEAINSHPDSLDINILREKAWQAVRHYYLERLESLIEIFGEARSKDRGADTLEQVAHAAVEGRVATLLIEADRQIPGHVDTLTGDIVVTETFAHEDLLDGLGEQVLKKGGQIVVAPADRMPTKTGVAAIYRY